MFLTGENDHRVRDGFAELHDSDGLLMLTSANEWLWRPLANPRSRGRAPFWTEALRALASCSVTELSNPIKISNSPTSPASYFVEPKGDWGSGRVELIELSSPDETNDNIVASGSFGR